MWGASATIMDEDVLADMVEYIQTNCEQDGKYVVTIRLYESAEDTTTPLTEFQAYLTMSI